MSEIAKDKHPQHAAMVRWASKKPNAHDYPEDWPGENGCYGNECCLCHECFMGHKRRVVCRVCYLKKPEEP